MAPYRILFICWGNICRSPTAEAIMRRQVEAAGLADHIEIDSAGTSAEHLGEPPDRRACTEADRWGLDLRDQRARRVTADDWDSFDLLLVADDVVERSLIRQAPAGADLDKVAHMTGFGDGAGRTGDAGMLDGVPDPYYGGRDGFQQVFDLLEGACAGILAHVQRVRTG